MTFFSGCVRPVKPACVSGCFREEGFEENFSCQIERKINLLRAKDSLPSCPNGSHKYRRIFPAIRCTQKIFIECYIEYFLQSENMLHLAQSVCVCFPAKVLWPMLMFCVHLHFPHQQMATLHSMYPFSVLREQTWNARSTFSGCRLL